MKIKLYFSQTLFTLEQQLLSLFANKGRDEHAIFVCPYAKRLNVKFLETQQVVVLPYIATRECHQKLAAGLQNIIGRHVPEAIEIHFPVMPYGVSLLALEAIRCFYPLKDRLRLHIWDGDIEDLVNRELLTQASKNTLSGLRDELELLLKNQNINFLLRADHKILFYVFHELLNTTYHLVRTDLLQWVNNKSCRDALMKFTRQIDSECVKQCERKIQLMLIKALGGHQDIFKKMERYTSSQTVMINYSRLVTMEKQLQYNGLKEHDRQYFDRFCRNLAELKQLAGYSNIVVQMANVDGNTDVSEGISERYPSLTFEDECSLFVLHALAALPEKLGGFADIYTLAFPAERFEFSMLHENLDYASTIKYHRFLTRAGLADNFIYGYETDILLGKSDRTDVLITMMSSLGDCMFALAAIKALRKMISQKIIFLTHGRYADLARHNPYIDRVITLEDKKEHAQMIYRQNEISASACFCDYEHIVSHNHQIEACLQTVGLTAAPESLDMDIVLSAEEHTRVDEFIARHGLGKCNVVLLHANIGDPNRTWPGENWNSLAERFIESGWRVVAIGNTNNKYAETQVYTFDNPAVINAVDAFSVLESIYLMRKCQLLVATDSGPVALAGASDIAIVSLYTIVPGHRRIAWRHGSLGWNALCVNLKCRYGHCMQLSTDAHFCKKILNTTIQVRRLNDWCPLGDIQGAQARYSCIKDYAAESLFKEITQFIASDKYVRQANA